MALLELRDVSKSFGDVEAVREVSLDVEAGEIVAVVGYSGAGKSTLVRLVNLLEPVTSGTVTVDGVELSGLAERDLRQLRRSIGMIFQQFNLLNSRTVYGNLEYPLRIAGVPREQRHQRVSDLLHFVGLADKAHARVATLSGGQKQRVGIARALANEPKLLLADEATSALDPETTGEVLDLLARVNRELGITIVVITHEMDVVARIASRVVVMEAGRIVEEGPVAEVFAHPRQPVTARFVGSVVAQEPDPERVDVLRGRHRGRLVSVRVDERTPQGDLFAAIVAEGAAVEIAHGGISDIGGATFGTVTLALTGDPASVDAAIGRVAAIADAKEL